MIQQQSLRVLDEQAEDTDLPDATPGGSSADIGTQVPDYYSDAGEADLLAYEDDDRLPQFVNGVLDELGKDVDAASARVVDAMPDTLDINFGVLLAYPDQSLMFLGSDPTAKDTVPWFAFTIDPFEPLPTPETAQEALDLLKPPEVKDLIEDEDWLPDRHGEWWLMPTAMVPAGTVFKPGFTGGQYGPSPLGNHVPREYAFTVTDDTFMQRFRDAADHPVPSSIATPPEVIDWVYRQHQKPEVPSGVPDWAEIRSFAEDVLVRGTIRHRDNDHYDEQVDTWHKATTHRVEVYTADSVLDIHLDYYGQ